MYVDQINAYRALTEFLEIVTRVLKIVEPLIAKTTQEELDKGVKL